MSRQLLGFVGESGSGKDTAAMYVGEKYKFEYISSSDYLRSYCRQQGLPWRSRKEVSRSADKIRIQHGSTFIIEESIRNASANKIVISGIYSYTEAECVAKQGHIIRLRSPLEKRYRNITERDQERDKRLSYSEFKSQSVAEVEKPRSQDLKSLAVFSESMSIDNTGTVPELYHKIDLMMAKLYG